MNEYEVSSLRQNSPNKQGTKLRPENCAVG